MIDSREFQLRRPDGRAMQVTVSGPDDGRPLVFHYGTPSAGIPFGPLIAAAATQGLRTIVYSRPGYAQSSPRPGRSVADAVGDVEGILDELGADRFVTIGWSGGGPHALACAALLPQRCLACATIAGVAPYTASGLDWMAGMGPENVEEFGLAVEGEAALSPWLEREAAALKTVQGADIAAALGGLVSDVDRTALTGEFADFMARSFRAAVSSGITGWRDDDLAFVRDWGFGLQEIRVPVTVWQGQQDRMVPFSHGQWLAQHIPAARSRLLPDEGHLSLAVSALDRILADLVEQAVPAAATG